MTGGSEQRDDVPEGRGRTGRGGRLAAALVLAVGGLIGIAMVAGGIGRADDSEEFGVPTEHLDEALDGMIMALLTMGLALTIAVFIVQFGGEHDRRESGRRRRLLGALLVPIVLVGMLMLANAMGLSFDLSFEPEEQEEVEAGTPAPVDLAESTESVDRSQVSSWAGIAFGLLIIGVVTLWMFGERRRRAVDLEESHAEERRDLAGLLDVTIDELRDDPDPRRAVIRAWNQLGAALASVGLPRDDAEPPFPYLERALGALETSAAAATRLTETFEVALFSTRHIDRAAQLDAVAALSAVRDELRVGVR